MRLSYRKIGVVVALIMLMGLLYLIYISVDRSSKISLNIDFLPDDATVTIDGRRVSRGTVYLEPGTYEVKASREGFSDYNDSSLVLNTSSKERFYAIEMLPESDEAKKWIKDNPEAVYRLTRHGYKAFDERNRYLTEKNPITKHLPYKNFLYSIGHYADPADPEDIVVVIDAPEGYRQAALYRIRELGYDPTDFNIIFRDYENPFPL